MKLEIGVLASHNATSIRPSVEAALSGELNASFKAFISNNSTSQALEYAREKQIPAYHISSKTHDNPALAIRETFLKHGVNLVILSGYMRRLQQATIDGFPNAVLNVHPSLLPKYGGEEYFGDRVHEAVLENHDKYTGATIHLIVDESLDTGPIVARRRLMTQPQETVETLRAKVQNVEKNLFLNVLRDLASDYLDLNKI